VLALSMAGILADGTELRTELAGGGPQTEVLCRAEGFSASQGLLRL
jgi:hypothetical protein